MSGPPEGPLPAPKTPEENRRRVHALQAGIVQVRRGAVEQRRAKGNRAFARKG